MEEEASKVLRTGAGALRRPALFAARSGVPVFALTMPAGLAAGNRWSHAATPGFFAQSNGLESSAGHISTPTPPPPPPHLSAGESGGGEISARQERAAALVGNPLRNTLQGGMVGRPGYTRLCLRGFVSTSASLSCCHNESCNDSNGFLFMQEVQPASGLMQDPPA